MGNFEFNASEPDLHEAIDRLFKSFGWRRLNGQLKYGFIEISWARRAPIQIFDLCIWHSGKIQVNPRPIYFRYLRDKGKKQYNKLVCVHRTAMLPHLTYYQENSKY